MVLFVLVILLADNGLRTVGQQQEDGKGGEDDARDYEPASWDNDHGDG
jgi:hypothetical protein